MRLHKYIVGV